MVRGPRVPTGSPPLVAQVALTPQSTRPRYLGDVRAIGTTVPAAPSTDRPLGVRPRSQALVRGTGCVNRARPGLWEPGASSRLGPPGHNDIPRDAATAAKLSVTNICKTSSILSRIRTKAKRIAVS
jgi:hypothetical protein